MKIEYINNRLYIAFFALLPLLGFLSNKAVLPLILVLGVLSLFVQPREVKNRILGNRAYRSLIGLGFLGVMSGFWSPDSTATFEKGAEVLAIFILGIVTILGCSSKESLKYLPLFAYSMIGLLILTFIELLFQFPLMVVLGRVSEELSLFYKDAANYMILFLSVLSFPAFYLLKSKHGKLIGYGFLLLTTVAIFIGVNVAALLGFIGGLVILGLTKLSRQFTLYAVFISLLVSLWATPFVVKQVFEMKPEKLMSWKLAHAGHRLEIWDFITKKALEQPVTGFGLDAAKTVGKIEYAKLYSEFDTVSHPHNFIIQLWFDLGIIGVALMSVFFFFLFRKFKDNIGSAVFPVQMASFVAVLSSALFSYGMWQGWWLAFLFATTLILIALQKREVIR